jgi:hypothetical protein
MAKRLPVVRNIAELGRGIPKGELRIHFTKEQWRGLTRGARAAKGVPKFGPRLEFTPDPNGDGTAQLMCGSGEIGERCIGKMSQTPGGDLKMDCQCRGPKPAFPPKGVPSRGRCGFVVPTKGGRRARCFPATCSGRCEVRTTAFRNILILYCACVTT